MLQIFQNGFSEELNDGLPRQRVRFSAIIDESPGVLFRGMHGVKVKLSETEFGSMLKRLGFPLRPLRLCVRKRFHAKPQRTQRREF